MGAELPCQVSCYSAQGDWPIATYDHVNGHVNGYSQTGKELCSMLGRQTTKQIRPFPFRPVKPDPPESPSSVFPNHLSRTSTTLSTPQLTIAMFLQRSAIAVTRRAAVSPVLRRSFATTLLRRESISLPAARPPERRHTNQPETPVLLPL